MAKVLQLQNPLWMWRQFGSIFKQEDASMHYQLHLKSTNSLAKESDVKPSYVISDEQTVQKLKMN